MKEVGDTGVAIAERFFFAIEELANRKVIRGLGTFARRYNLNYGNLYMLKCNIKTRNVRTEYLAYLAQDYGVSSEWLLLGNGEMFVEGAAALYPKPAKR